ncbi:hypothetical protein PPL_06081 [Heterostelium album PN500]|uniref:Uncharacterized protein n=1 Tax=Heterostelium pallidum (strain ATCC 26659 / Pp 5 / PN500) TaxID=670386 RepID=D3BC59_HETP5|nr:hypothetical protein PPL_06081 [Heterostelium album PN500]EFA81242.1 hypothetical protein PPL_06081 [Heterostelium album PN500]|eukprot:XP_020433360.1 hypothetical protein PPL_06081 [Heterostelium album PN500]
MVTYSQEEWAKIEETMCRICNGGCCYVFSITPSGTSDSLICDNMILMCDECESIWTSYTKLAVNDASNGLLKNSLSISELTTLFNGENSGWATFDDVTNIIKSILLRMKSINVH